MHPQRCRHCLCTHQDRKSWNPAPNLSSVSFSFWTTFTLLVNSAMTCSLYTQLAALLVPWRNHCTTNLLVLQLIIATTQNVLHFTIAFGGGGQWNALSSPERLTGLQIESVVCYPIEAHQPRIPLQPGRPNGGRNALIHVQSTCKSIWQDRTMSKSHAAWLKWVDICQL